MKKLKLTSILLILILNLSSQNNNTNSLEIGWTTYFSDDTINDLKATIDTSTIEWTTYYCGGTDNEVESLGDTLIITPNPVDSLTNIQFNITNQDTVSLTVFTATGKIIKTYYNAIVLPIGLYNNDFIADTLPDGMYFVELKINSTKTLTVKLIKGVNTVGLKENRELKNVQIYPNPTNSFLNITSENNQLQNTTIDITNYLGQSILSIPFSNQLNLSSLVSGIYYLTLSDSTNKKTVKIIKE